MNVGFIGLGAMGLVFAEKLIQAGHSVTAWNRSPGPLAALAARGAVAAQTPEEAMQGDVLFSMLATDAALAAVGLDGPLLDKARKGLIHINMATISIALAAALAHAHEARGLSYVAAPVFARPDAVAAGNAVIVTAGAPEAVARVMPLFEKLGRRTDIVGTRPEQASLFKIAGNFLIASALDSMSEAFTLLAKGGADAQQFYALMTETLFAAPIYKNYGRLVLERNFTPAFQLRLGLKDVKLAQEAAGDLDMTMPIADVLRHHLEDAVADGLGDQDWTAVSQIIARQAGA
jgi:3-hydroxyisobutyrate dehydrogenase-like beta-hydroxyacid dehydrogenase